MLFCSIPSTNILDEHRMLMDDLQIAPNSVNINNFKIIIT